MRLIVPNGLFKIIIPYKNGLKSIINNKTSIVKEGTITIIGIADTHAVIDSYSEEEIGSVGIEFKPFAAYHFFRLSMKELSNQVFGAEEILGKEGRDFQSSLSDSQSAEERIKKTENFLLTLLFRNNNADAITDYAVNQIVQSFGRITMKELSRKTGYTTRYLEMKFAENIGINPKTLGSVYRFQKFYQAWGKYQENRFFEQELYNYYYDHSHFIREFKRFTGLAPTKFLKNENEFGRIFYKD